ncbi:MAG: hypothetical protein V7765_08295 [Oleispira sp.]
MNDYLMHGILECEWQIISGTPHVKKTLGQQQSTIPLESSSCCISDLTPVVELSSEKNTIFLSMIKKYLMPFRLKKITLIGYDAKNVTHQDIHKMLNDEEIEAKVFPTASHAKQWLLLPDVDADIWHDTVVATY